MMNTHHFSLLGGLKAWAVAAMENNHNHHHDHDHDHGNVCDDSFSDASADQIEKVEAFDLLDESWFFENLFNRRRRMVRCFSDPCTSSSINQDHVLAKDIHSANQSSSASSEKKMQEKSSAAQIGLIRAPSLPPCMGKEEKVEAIRKSKLNRQLSLQASRTTCTEKRNEIQEKKSERKNKLLSPSGSNNLIRAPSLPTYIGNIENENDIRMSKLIRQALSNSLDTLPPRHSPKKAITRSCSMQKFRPPRNLEAEPISNNNTNRVQFKEMRRRCSSQKPLQKSRSDLAFQELQGFKDLGFRFEKEDLSPGVVNMLPGLQENMIEELKQDKVRRPYLSEAWLAQSLAPPIPNSVSKNSAADMKAQLKFWARAVATNVRQEC